MPLMTRLVATASQSFPRLSRHVLASAGYTLDLDAFGPDAFRVWDRRTAERQDRSWAPLVAQAIAGSPRKDIAALWNALDALPQQQGSFLEVGCGGGYNSELIAHHAPKFGYTGLDLSDSMVDIAGEKYPDRDFRVGSATSLPFGDNSYDAVMDGVALLHIPDWRSAIREYARVASMSVVLHGLTLTDRPTIAFAKYAYGQPSREFVFQRSEVLDECARRGLTLQRIIPGDDYDLEEYLGIPSVSETWVLGH